MPDRQNDQKRKFSMPSTSSPLSPKMESLAIPSPVRRRPPPSPMHHRKPSSSIAASLRLPSLPRFHPANFPSSQGSSAAATPRTGPNSPLPPLSPRAYHQQYSDAQKRVLALQRELMSGQPRQTRASGGNPSSPRLIPMGSPGPVTPLELETAEGYLTAGIATGDAASHVDKLIREEARRRGETSPGRPTSVGGR